MKITDIKVINFAAATNYHSTKWGYAQRGSKRKTPLGIIKIETDEGYSGIDAPYSDGYYSPPSIDVVENAIKPLLVGQDPRNIERLWQWMMAHIGIPERAVGSVDCALWDLMGKLANSPTYKYWVGHGIKSLPTLVHTQTWEVRMCTLIMQRNP